MPLRSSSRATSVQSGSGLSTVATSGVGGNSNPSRMKSSQSAGSGQLSPASPARRTYSATVERARPRLAANLPRCQSQPPAQPQGFSYLPHR